MLLDSPPLARAPGNGAEIAAEQRAFRRELGTQTSFGSARLALSARRERLFGDAPALRLRPPPRSCPVSARPPRDRDLRATADLHAAQIGASALWGPTLETAGQGDEDRDHRLRGSTPTTRTSTPTGYTMPPGFPKGQQRFTTAKVIVARVVSPQAARRAERAARVQPATTRATAPTSRGSRPATPTPRPAGRRISGVAPRAYLGNYKVFVETDSGLSPNANSPAIVAAIEAAVPDGMDVINFSGGEPEIEPSRDIVALALDAAAAAGVVPVSRQVTTTTTSAPARCRHPATPRARSRSERSTSAAPGGADARRLLFGRADDDLAAPQAGRLGARRRRALVGLGGRLGGALGNEHGGAPRRRRRGAAPSAAPGLDGGSRSSRRSCSRASTPSTSGDAPAGPAVPGRRRRRASDAPTSRCSSPTPTARLLRAPRPRAPVDPDGRPRGRRRRRRDMAGRRVSRQRPSGGGQRRVAGDGDGAGRATRSRRRRRRTAAPGDLDAYVELRRGGDARRVPLWGRVTAAALAGTGRSLSSGPGSTARRRADKARVRHTLPLSGEPRGIGVTTTLRGPERVVPAPDRQAGRQLRRRRHAARSRKPRRAEGRCRTRRKPPYRVRGPPVNHNPYSDQFLRGVLAAGALSPLPGRLRHRLRQRVAGRSRARSRSVTG